MTKFTCNECNTTGDTRWMTSHNCSHNQYVNEHGGRCEDYPCCGHTDGDGCAALESHTSAYWLDLITANAARDDYDEYSFLDSMGDDGY